MCISGVPINATRDDLPLEEAEEGVTDSNHVMTGAPSGYHYWYANETGGITLRSVSGVNQQNSTLLNLERASAILLSTQGTCCRQRSKLFCMPNITNEHTSTIMDLLFDEHLVMICTMDALSQCTRIPLPLSWPPDSQSHGNPI